MCRFGPAGNSPSFYASGGKSSTEVPQWLNKLGLNAYEYQCGRGVRISRETAEAIGEQARIFDIAVSIHAPYFINLCTADGEKLAKTKKYLQASVQLARWMGANTVVFHPGSVHTYSREDAFNLASAALGKWFAEGFSELAAEGIHLAPETMGKKNQFGSLDEVLRLCKLFDLVPAVDFAHLHALGQGALRTEADFERTLEAVQSELGDETVSNLHVHFSPIEYGSGGERRHRATPDTGYGPDFSLLAASIVKHSLHPTIICESHERQVEDALLFKEILDRKKKETAL